MSYLKSIINVLVLLLALVVSAQEEEKSIWPKDIDTKAGTITIYQPENSSYVNNHLKSNLAFAYKKENEDPVFGMLWVDTLLDVDRTNREASLVSVEVEEVRFADEVTDEQKNKLEALINAEIPKWEIQFPLDDLIASLEEVSVTEDKYKNTPPHIYFAKEPTALISIDGEPKLKNIEEGYALVQNSGSFILEDSKSNTYYLLGGEFWYNSKNVTGPYEPAEKIPEKVKKIAKKAQPEGEAVEDKNSKEDEYEGKQPKIKIVTEPSELIVFDGDPKYTPIQNTNLLYVENTESDIFMNIKGQSYFLLISGRWYTTKDLKGDWTFIKSQDLPEDFRNIDSESKKADVLANVFGTEEAKNAVYDAQLPQTASVDRDTKANNVVYNGTPEFKNIENLKLKYAVNTESAVFLDNNIYYLCDNAIWFKSSTPNGPWIVSDERPDHIEDIPASNPKYNTKYVYIYEASPKVVYVGYTPGYHGSYYNGFNVVYGTGYYYNPWYNSYYYHHHYTWGFSVRYNPWYGWSVGFRYGSPYGWYGYSYWGSGYNHWGPPYYRPAYYNRRYYQRRAYPMYRGRNGVRHYNRSSTLPSRYRDNRSGGRSNIRPNTRPNTRPSTRPSTRPNTRPSTRPNTRPTQRPTTKPATRPTNRPSYNRPTTRPYTNQHTPNYRSSSRPTSRPVARPSTRSFNQGGRMMPRRR